MRKITNNAVNAFKAGREFKGSNTKVIVEGDKIRMYLHDNLIAQRSNTVLTITSAGWETNTTKERLNGVLQAFSLPTIYQKNFVWYIGEGKKFKGSQTFKF